MLIKISDIPINGLNLELTLKREEFTKIEKQFEFDQVTYQFNIRAIQDQVGIRGKYQVQVTCPCDRCLNPAILDLDEEFELDLVRTGSIAESSTDMEFSVASTDLDYFEGQEVNPVRYLEDQILIDLPYLVLCNADCKGLCPQCGINKNTETCNCDEVNPNSPFAVLKDLK